MASGSKISAVISSDTDVTAPPLTHHEIFRVAAPFMRSGHQVDLSASDRAARRLCFKPVDLVGSVAASPASTQLSTRASTASPASDVRLRQALRLECPADGHFRLTSMLTDAVSGLVATLQAEGPQPAELLARVEGVPLAQLLRCGAGFRIARSYDVMAAGSEATGAGLAMTLRHGAVRVGTWTLALEVKPKRGAAGDITLAAAGGDGVIDLPEDLLAVLGWDWTRLVAKRTGWVSKLRLRGGLGRRTRNAEKALDIAARHLAQVFGEAPSQFHRRHRWARFAVVLRRAIPSLTAIGLIVGALLLPRVGDGAHAGLWMALQYLPIALLALSFQLQELPRFEIPPWPRRLRATQWSAAAVSNDGEQAAVAVGAGRR